jgi:hypothetical protein
MTKHLSAGLKSRASGTNNDATKGSNNANDGSHEKLLLCPVRAGLPDRYAKVTKHCTAKQAFRDVSKLKEHLERVHSPFRRCSECWKDFPGATLRDLEKTMVEHLKECLGSKPDEEEQLRLHTVMTRDQYREVRDWSRKPKHGSKGGNEEGAISRHYKTICGIINPGQKQMRDTRKPHDLNDDLLESC